MNRSPNTGKQETTNLSPQLAVVGGGLAGTFAAISAARLGISVVLLQERPVLGGNSSSEIRVHPVGASQHGYRRDSRETGLMEELFLDVRARSYGQKQFNGRHYPMWDVILSEMAEAEPTLTLYLNTRVVSVETATDARDGYESRVTRLVAVQQASEQVFEITPELVIDASGDGFVAVQAGAPFRYGREAKSEFGESWAPETPDEVVLGSTIMFSAKDVGRPVPYTPPAWAHSFPTEESLPFRPHHDVESGYWWLEWGGRLNTIADNDAIRRELHAAVFGVWDHIKNHCTEPGVREKAANYSLDWIGHIPGKRESRRFEGDHLMIEQDLLDGMHKVPADVVAYGGWPIDLHAPDGVYSPDKPCTQPPLPDIYGIPFRSLYSRTISNLLLAGRNISQTHVAHGSSRVMKTTAVIGEGAGTAAAIALLHQVSPRSLSQSESLVREVQQQLLRQGAYLPRVKSTDESDLVQLPGVTFLASSEAELRVDVSSGSEPIWEFAGISDAESAAFATELGNKLEGSWHQLNEATGQSFVLTASTLERISLPLQYAGTTPLNLTLSVRQGLHLRDFTGTDLGELRATIAPGTSSVEFVAETPIAVQPNAPVVVSLEANPDLQWGHTWQEPPGTQAGRWDEGLAQWRWIHGTLGFAITPGSHPFHASNVASGITRPEITTNLWVSDPAESMPQWLDVKFPKTQTISQVELTFDSQLSGWVWEGVFPLVVRDYTVEGILGEKAVELGNVHGNYQRRNVLTFPATEVDSLRVTIHATNGGKTARIFEIRASNPVLQEQK